MSNTCVTPSASTEPEQAGDTDIFRALQLAARRRLHEPYRFSELEREGDIRQEPYSHGAR
jgi:hypothetical protein